MLTNTLLMIFLSHVLVLTYPTIMLPACLQGGVEYRVAGLDYLFGSYRIATVPEGNSIRLTSFRSTYFDKPANNVGP